MPIRLCLERKCGREVVYRGRCAVHARAREKRTHSPANKRVYNSKRWKALRKKVMAEQPICPCGKLTEDVDHIVPLEDGGDPFARDNVRGWCHSCHSRVTRRAQTA